VDGCHNVGDQNQRQPTQSFCGFAEVSENEDVPRDETYQGGRIEVRCPCDHARKERLDPL
jgi:hypothetical protein